MALDGGFPNLVDDCGGMLERMLFPTRTVVALAESATQTALEDVVAISHPLMVITWRTNRYMRM